MSYFKNLNQKHAVETAGRVYFSILERVQGKWGQQFGDFDKKVVQQELRDMKDSGDAPAAKDLIIVCTVPGEAALKVAVADMNKNFPDGTKERVIRYYVGEKSVI